LVGEVEKVLRRELGGAGARDWMDHELAADQPLTEELLQQRRVKVWRAERAKEMILGSLRKATRTPVEV